VVAVLFFLLLSKIFFSRGCSGHGAELLARHFMSQRLCRAEHMLVKAGIAAVFIVGTAIWLAAIWFLVTHPGPLFRLWPV